MSNTPERTKPALPGLLLDGLGKHEIDAILAAAATKRFEPHTIIFATGEPAKGLYLLQKGRVKFYRVTNNGQEIVLGLLIPGEAFGLSTLLAGTGHCMGTAEPVESCEAFVWERAAIRRLATLYPRLTESVLRIALHYVAQFAERHISLVSSTAEERLAHTLINLASRSGKATSVGLEVGIKNETLASLADINFFTASRLLKRWERQRAIKKCRGKVLIQDPAKLLVE
jgi:CRP-like cAMP-binding protein